MSLAEAKYYGNQSVFLPDMLFLACTVVALQCYYLFGLGFYSDDWNYLGILTNSKYTDVIGLSYTFFVKKEFLLRPIQTLQLAALYWLFGTNALGYHVFNTAFLVAGILLFNLILKELRLPRTVALGIPLIYALLPHYSTARLWIACSAINISAAFFFLNFYSNLCCMSREAGKHVWIWRVISLLSLLISVMAYEIILPLFLINFIVTWWIVRSKLISDKANKFLTINYLLLFNSILLGACVLFKAQVSLRTGGFNGHYVSLIASVYKKAIYNDFIVYGVKLPIVVWKIWLVYANGNLLLIAMLVAVCIFAYLARLGYNEFQTKQWLRVVLVGMIIYLMGYAMFLSTAQIQITPTGVSNRVTSAAALGVATFLFGITGLLSQCINNFNVKRLVFALCISMLSGACYLINGTIGEFYVKSNFTQRIILQSLYQDIPTLAPGKTVILDGVCSYTGSAPIFECYWDFGGALQAHYRTPFVQGDVRTLKLTYDRNGIRTRIYGEEKIYPYNQNLIIYNSKTRKKFILKDFSTAKAYFAAGESANLSNCPKGGEGYGAAIF